MALRAAQRYPDTGIGGQSASARFALAHVGKLNTMEVQTRLTDSLSARRYDVFASLVAVVLSALLGLAMVKLGTVQRDLKIVFIVVAGIAVITAALRPEIGLVMLLILMPFEFSFSGTGTDEAATIAVALVLVWRIQMRSIPAWAAIGGFALIAGSFLSALGAYDRTEAIWGGIRWLAAIILLFVALTILRDRRDAARRMVDVFTGSAVVVVIFAFVQSVGIKFIVGATFNPGHASSFFGYYTNYAGYIAIAAVLATGEILTALREHRPSRVAIYSAALLFLLVGEALAASRGGLLALAVGWLTLLVLNARRGPVLIQAIVILTLFAGAGYIVTPPSTISKVEQRFAAPLGSQSSDKTRFALQHAGETALKENPWGLGFANFAYYLRAHVRSLQIRQGFAHAQNTPIQIGLDAGWLGAIGFLMLTIWPIGLVLLRGTKGSSGIRASACAAALTAFMAQGLYDYLFFEIAFLVFIAVLIWGTIHALSVNQTTSLGGRAVDGTAPPAMSH
jgi:hypothetical protein